MNVESRVLSTFQNILSLEQIGCLRSKNVWSDESINIISLFEYISNQLFSSEKDDSETEVEDAVRNI